MPAVAMKTRKTIGMKKKCKTDSKVSSERQIKLYDKIFENLLVALN